MCVLPIGLAYWRDESQVRPYAKGSSQATRKLARCGRATRIMEATTEVMAVNSETCFSENFTARIYLLISLHQHKTSSALTLPFGAPLRPESRIDLEQYYFKHHPLLRLIPETQGPIGLPKDSKFQKPRSPPLALPCRCSLLFLRYQNVR